MMFYYHICCFETYFLTFYELYFFVCCRYNNYLFKNKFMMIFKSVAALRVTSGGNQVDGLPPVLEYCKNVMVPSTISRQLSRVFRLIRRATIWTQLV